MPVDFDAMVPAPEAENEAESAIVPIRSYSTVADFAPDEVAFPRLRLAQGQTPEVQAQQARAGQWVLSGEVPHDSVVIVPLAFARRRELREGLERTKTCESPDSLVGYGLYAAGSEQNPSGLCADCPMAKWTANPKDPNKNFPPVCTFIYSYIAYSVTHKQVVSLDFSKTGMTAAKFLNTFVKSRGFGNCAVQLESVQQRTQRGTFSVPTVKAAVMTNEIAEEAHSSAIL